MDLRLGLSLSYHPTTSPASCDNEFDLNEEFMGSIKKRCFDKAFDSLNSNNHCHHHHIPQTLSLFDKSEHRIENVEEEEEEEAEVVVVGWPPIKLLKKKKKTTTTTTTCCQNSSEGTNVNCVDEKIGVSNGSNGISSRNKSLFVKVKMEGVGIARKVDLCLHQSPQTLFQTLLTMFGKSNKKKVYAYQLMFQDKEGCWRLAEDVPWRDLITSVYRLQLSKKTC